MNKTRAAKRNLLSRFNMSNSTLCLADDGVGAFEQQQPTIKKLKRVKLVLPPPPAHHQVEQSGLDCNNNFITFTIIHPDAWFKETEALKAANRKASPQRDSRICWPQSKYKHLPNDSDITPTANDGDDNTKHTKNMHIDTEKENIPVGAQASSSPSSPQPPPNNTTETISNNIDRNLVAGSQNSLDDGSSNINKYENSTTNEPDDDYVSGDCTKMNMVSKPSTIYNVCSSQTNTTLIFGAAKKLTAAADAAVAYTENEDFVESDNDSIPTSNYDLSPFVSSDEEDEPEIKPTASIVESNNVPEPVIDVTDFFDASFGVHHHHHHHHNHESDSPVVSNDHNLSGESTINEWDLTDLGGICWNTDLEEFNLDSVLDFVDKNVDWSSIPTSSDVSIEKIASDLESSALAFEEQQKSNSQADTYNAATATPGHDECFAMCKDSQYTYCFCENFQYKDAPVQITSNRDRDLLVNTNHQKSQSTMSTDRFSPPLCNPLYDVIEFPIQLDNDPSDQYLAAQDHMYKMAEYHCGGESVVFLPLTQNTIYSMTTSDVSPSTRVVTTTISDVVVSQQQEQLQDQIQQVKDQIQQLSRSVENIEPFLRTAPEKTDFVVGIDTVDGDTKIYTTLNPMTPPYLMPTLRDSAEKMDFGYCERPMPPDIIEFSKYMESNSQENDDYVRLRSSETMGALELDSPNLPMPNYDECEYENGMRRRSLTDYSIAEIFDIDAEHMFDRDCLYQKYHREYCGNQQEFLRVQAQPCKVKETGRRPRPNTLALNMGFLLTPQTTLESEDENDENAQPNFMF